MYDCLVIGDVTIDTFLVIDKAHLQCAVDGDQCEICFDFGAKIPIRDSHQSIGGNAANVSSGLTRLGNEVALLSELGDDLNGHTAMEVLTDIGVDTSLCKLRKGKDTRYSIVVNFQSDRTVFSYHAPRRYHLPKALPQTEWIYYTSLGKSFEQLQAKLITYLKKNKAVKVAMNPGSYQIHDGLRTLRKVLPYLSVLFVNKEEACMLTGKKEPIAECTARLHDKGVGVVVITDGEAGSYAYDGDTLLHMPIYPIAPISKTGAGDAYATGFLAAYMDGHEIGTCMQWGTANAGGVVQIMGAQAGQLNETEITKLVDHYKKTTPTEVV